MLTQSFQVMTHLIESGQDAWNDAIYGAALTTAGIYRTKGSDGKDGSRATARGQRKLFLRLGFLTETDRIFTITRAGQELLGAEDNITLRKALWRKAMLNLQLEDDGGNLSHPYRILLRLVGDFPGIETKKLLLALEAVNDSEHEYIRIKALAELDFEEIVRELAIGTANAANAVKVFPSIAEQVGDITRTQRHSFLIGNALSTEDGLLESEPVPTNRPRRPPRRTQPTAVTPQTIAAIPNFNPQQTNPVDLNAAIEIRRQRTISHHNAVRSLAELLVENGYTIHENPYDCLGFKPNTGGLLGEIKTLDGSISDELRQSEKALGQLKAYSYYDIPDNLKAPGYVEIAFFSERPTDDTIGFLRHCHVKTAWLENGHWFTTDLSGNIVNFLPDSVFDG